MATTAGWRRALAVWYPLLLAPAALAQLAPSTPDMVIRSLIPDVIALRSPKAASIDFPITPLNYPPPSFPFRYTSAAQTFAVLSSGTRPWTVQLEVQPRAGGAGRLPDLKHLSYRLNGGGWLPVTATPQVVLSGVSATLGWQPLTIEFALEVQAGDFGAAAFEVRFTATVLP